MDKADRIEELEAQVAVMAEALRFILIRVKPLGELMAEGEWVQEWAAQAEQALQSAPTVLYATAGKGEGGGVTTGSAISATLGYITLPPSINLDGQECQVIVLAHPKEATE